MVAFGNLDRIWTTVPDFSSSEAFQKTFQNHFGAKWEEILDAAEKSFAYNSFNTAYFSVKDFRPLENMTLDKLLEKEGKGQPPNIVVS